MSSTYKGFLFGGKSSSIPHGRFSLSQNNCLVPILLHSSISQELFIAFLMSEPILHHHYQTFLSTPLHSSLITAEVFPQLISFGWKLMYLHSLIPTIYLAMFEVRGFSNYLEFVAMKAYIPCIPTYLHSHDCISIPLCKELSEFLLINSRVDIRR